MSRENDARRDLLRIEREREKLLSGSTPTAGEDDAVERLGKRIARILGPLIAVALFLYIAATYLT